MASQSKAFWDDTILIEQAKEELEILETPYPNRFNYLKFELQSFISHLHSHDSPASPLSPPTSSTAATQGSSTSGKKRKKGGDFEVPRSILEGNGEATKQKLQRVDVVAKDRVDVSIEKARACLHKIQLFKIGFG